MLSDKLLVVPVIAADVGIAEVEFDVDVDDVVVLGFKRLFAIIS
jgi:hypothetical protein